MPDSETKQRPVRKLTVRNFSVIKDAELQFGKITVLIGPEATGKSLLCKLAYFLRYDLVGAAVDAATSRRTWEELQKLVDARFRLWFPPDAWKTQDFHIRFQFDRYSVELSSLRDAPKGQSLEISTSEEFKDIFQRMAFPSVGALVPPALEKDAIWGEFMRLQDGTAMVQTHFIPAGRSFFTSTELGFASLQNPGLDPLVRRFATEVIWNPAKWMPGLTTSGRNTLDSVNKTMERIAGGAVIMRGNEPVFKTREDETLPLSLLSSGTQELLPLFNVLRRLAYESEHLDGWIPSRDDSKASDRLLPIKQVLYLEEPETHIFPNTQRELVQLFAWLANDPVLNFDWVITTHSPYILSSFNNLIEAGQAARKNPKLQKRIAKIIPEHFWIRDGEFAAYKIENGKLESILNESGFVDANYLDQVSEVIGDEFDKLLRLEYERTKAS